MLAQNPDQYTALLPKKRTTPAPPPRYADPNDPAVQQALAASAASNPPPVGAGIDYSGYIDNDPIYRQQKADLSAQGIQDAATRKAATARAFANWGEVPDFSSAINGLGLDPSSPMFQMLFGDIDPATRKAAQDMTTAGLSQSAQLAQQHTKNINDLMEQLAARGIVRSGATMSGANAEDQRYTNAQFTGRQNLLDYLTGVQSAFSEGERARQGQLASGAGSATDRQIALHPYVEPSPGQPGSSTYFGAPPGVDFGDPTAGGGGQVLGPMPPVAPGATSRANSQSVQNALVKRLNLPE